MRLLALACLMMTGCLPPLVGQRCDSEHPCFDGFACDPEGRCQSTDEITPCSDGCDDDQICSDDYCFLAQPGSDAGNQADGGDAPTDGGDAPVDSGTDSGTHNDDSGAPKQDAGASPSDGGPHPTDAGVETDAGDPGDSDAGVETDAGDPGDSDAGHSDAGHSDGTFQHFTNFDPATLTFGPSLVLNCGQTVTLTTEADGGVTFSDLCVSAPTVSSVEQPGGPRAVVLAVEELTVAAGTTVVVEGPLPLIFVVDGDVVIDGVLTATSTEAAPCVDGTGTNAAEGNGQRFTGAGGGGFGTSGASGGGTNGAGAVPGGTAEGQALLSPLRGGCAGGAVDGVGAGAGGGGLQITARQSVTLRGVVAAPGEGGDSTPGAKEGGGGGGSGGAILLEAASILIEGTAALTANGGGGAGGGASGEVGAPGAISSGVPASGGQPGSGGGAGGAGAVATSSAVDGAYGGSSGGGGGGGAGRVRLNAAQCSVGGSAVFSPAPVTTGGCEL